MEHKTMTTLSEMRIGDSFTFKPNRKDVWRVMAKADKNGRVAVNQVINGITINKHDELKKASTKVMFLRHTIPVRGEECFVEDLIEGDVFFKTDDIIHEWELTRKAHPGSGMCGVRRLDEAANSGYTHYLTKVVFVRHKEDK